MLAIVEMLYIHIDVFKGVIFAVIQIEVLRADFDIAHEFSILQALLRLRYPPVNRVWKHRISLRVFWSEG